VLPRRGGIDFSRVGSRVVVTKGHTSLFYFPLEMGGTGSYAHTTAGPWPR
jgi:hypothetical protein